MRKWLLFTVIVCLLSVSVVAQTCTDSDNGGDRGSDEALKVKGDVKYGITTLDDTCLTSQNGVSVNQSIWLKEYYCDDDKRESKVYNCLNEGYTGCEVGACVDTGTGSNTTTTTPRTAGP